MSGIGGVDNKILESLGLTSTQTKDKKELGQDDFLKLLVAQMKHQNPLEPQENGDFLAQMAQFGTVDGIGNLQKSFDNLSSALQSNQALQASSLVGRNVFVPGNSATLVAGESVKGAVELSTSASDVKVAITSSSGELVQTLSLGSQAAGTVNFAWDGKTASGGTATPGEYTIKVSAISGNTTTELTPLVSANVDSVTLGTNGAELQLNLAGKGTVPLSQVKQISQ